MIFIAIAAALCALSLIGCESLTESSALFAQKDYEKLIVGRFDSDYVGTENCLRACHAHDKIREDFEASTMGAQMSRATGLSLVDCESCHGPGSLAIEGLTEESVMEAEARGEKPRCKHETLIDLAGLPAQAQSLICLKCHTANATFNLHTWNSGWHAMNEVSCFDCHDVHSGADLIVKPRETYKMCLQCHEAQGAEFMMPSHHPVYEQKVMCTDCHDPHGVPNESQLRRETVKATCTQCHPDKEGPFVYEHAEITEDCTNCHLPHGSVNNYMLTSSTPFLCLQCHDGHTPSTSEREAAYYTRCTDCHSTIHGTDVPSASGRGRFTQ